jgi:iron complex outermembrane recepter protein
MWLIGAISVLVAASARANAGIVEVTVGELKQAKVPVTKIPQLSEIPHPHTSVKDWLAQEQKQNQVIQVTGVRLSPTASGLEVILETPISDKLQTTTKGEGNIFSVVIPNAQLRLPASNTFRSDKPIAGITAVVVENQDANSILVTIIGETGSPKAEIFDSDQGLIFGITPQTSSTQPQPQAPPTDKPSSESPQNKPSTAAEKPIELVVTGERDRSTTA